MSLYKKTSIIKVYKLILNNLKIKINKKHNTDNQINRVDCITLSKIQSVSSTKFRSLIIMYHKKETVLKNSLFIAILTQFIK